MGVREHSAGPLYFATVQLNQKRCPVHSVDITEVNPPWRKGKALVLSHRSYRAVVVGLWRRYVSHDEIVEGEDAPAWAGVLSYTPHELADWDDGSE